MTASRASRLSVSRPRGPVLSLGEQPAHLLVDDLLGAFGVGALLAERRPARDRTAGRIRSRSGPSRGDSPQSLTILMARSVAPERSLAAPVEASPMTRFSEARPPRRMASESRR